MRDRVTIENPAPVAWRHMLGINNTIEGERPIPSDPKMRAISLKRETWRSLLGRDRECKTLFDRNGSKKRNTGIVIAMWKEVRK
jgi:hypothetical protein